MKDKMDVFGEMFGWSPMETAFWRTKHKMGVEKMTQDVTKLLVKLAVRAKEELEND